MNAKLPPAAIAILVASATSILASDLERNAEEIVATDPAVIEQLDDHIIRTDEVPEPSSFGALCLGLAAVLYARRWRRRV